MNIFLVLFVGLRGVLVVLSFRSRKFVTPLFGILRVGFFILVDCCGSIYKFNTYFLRSLDASLFFRK